MYSKLINRVLIGDDNTYIVTSIQSRFKSSAVIPRKYRTRKYFGLDKEKNTIIIILGYTETVVGINTRTYVNAHHTKLK